MSDERIEVVLGAGLLGSFRYPDVESCRTYCEMFRPYGSRIDHARIYPAEAFGKAEGLMKTTGVNKWATMDTKVTALGNKEHSKESIVSSIDQSLEALGVDSVDVFYLHMPDRQVPFEESMEAVDRAYKKGKFRRLGLSNQSPDQVEQIVNIADKNGKSVFQTIVREAQRSLRLQATSSLLCIKATITPSIERPKQRSFQF
jgi:aflatoxin B1 aldehyde reductase